MKEKEPDNSYIKVLSNFITKMPPLKSIVFKPDEFQK